MKRIKFAILFLLVIMLSGCTVNYEINIKDNKITEKINAVETNSVLFDSPNDFGMTLRESLYAFSSSDPFSEENFVVNKIENENELGFDYTREGGLLESTAISHCYLNPIITDKDDIVTINTGTEFMCYDYYENLDTIRFVFKTNHKVISNNADSVSGNSYIWNISKDSNKQIEISYYKFVVDKSFNVSYVIIPAILLLGVLIILIIKKKSRKNNEI